MQYHLLSVEQSPPAWVDTGLKDYQKRLSRFVKVVMTPIPLSGKHKQQQSALAKQEEADRLIARWPKGSIVVAMDERGQHMTSQQLADQLGKWAMITSKVTFILGGPDGLDPGIKRKADFILQLSPMTLPHHLAKLMLLEQLYRAQAILNHHPYHRA